MCAVFKQLLEHPSCKVVLSSNISDKVVDVDYYEFIVLFMGS